jgi:hypothetical protein
MPTHFLGKNFYINLRWYKYHFKVFKKIFFKNTLAKGEGAIDHD